MITSLSIIIFCLEKNTDLQKHALTAFTKKHRSPVMWPNNINTLQWINRVEMVSGSYINIQVNIRCSCLTAVGMKPVPPDTDLVGEFSGHRWMSVKFCVWPQKNNVSCRYFFFFRIVWEVAIKRHICMLLFSSEGTWWDLREVEVWMWWVCGGGRG